MDVDNDVQTDFANIMYGQNLNQKESVSVIGSEFLFAFCGTHVWNGNVT